ncbi:hypothetical protein JCM24511_04349 [Saitozyma sp. JCM 24511]|nr:hypothetical protein JCM24511_04349 [Saitozyma sp. JCM 24511]
MSSQTTGTSAKVDPDMFTTIRESLPGSTEIQTRTWRERLERFCVEPDGSRSTLFQTLEKVITAAACRLEPSLRGKRLDEQVTALIDSAYAQDKLGFSWDSRSLDRSSIWILSLANHLSEINEQPDSAYSRTSSDMRRYWSGSPEIPWKLQLQASTALLLISVVHRGPRLLKSVTLRRHPGAMSDILYLALRDDLRDDADPNVLAQTSGQPVRLKSNLDLAEGSIPLSKTQQDVMSYLGLWLGVEGLNSTGEKLTRQEKSVKWNTLRMKLAEGLPDRFRDRSSTKRKDSQSSNEKGRESERGSDADSSRIFSNPQVTEPPVSTVSTVPTVPTVPTESTAPTESRGSSHIDPLLLGKHTGEQDAESEVEKGKDESQYEKGGSFAGQFFDIDMTRPTVSTRPSVSMGSSHIDPLLLGRYPEDAESEVENGDDKLQYENGSSFAGQFFDIQMAEASFKFGRLGRR